MYLMSLIIDSLLSIYTRPMFNELGSQSAILVISLKNNFDGFLCSLVL